MLTIACVNVNNYQGYGKEYVRKLHAMVKKNLHQPFSFECIKESDKISWWAKIDLFKPGRFSGRILYIDLDSVITGSLDELVEHKGIIDFRDWAKIVINDPFPPKLVPNVVNCLSGVMLWDAGEHEEIYTKYSVDVPKQFKGDQDWMQYLGGWKAIPPGMVFYYRKHCVDFIPKDCRICCMGGYPKPHEIYTGWVPEYWID